MRWSREERPSQQVIPRTYKWETLPEPETPGMAVGVSFWGGGQPLRTQQTAVTDRAGNLGSINADSKDHDCTRHLLVYQTLGLHPHPWQPVDN